MSDSLENRRPGGILMVVLNLQFGGQEKMIVDLSRCLQQRGHRVAVCCLDGAGPLADPLRRDDIPVVALRKAEGFSFKTARQLRRLIGEEQFSIVHSHNAPGLIYSSLAIAGLRRLNNVAHINTRHGDVATSRRTHRMNRIANANTDFIVAVSGDLQQQIVENECCDDSRLKVIVNGIDVAPFSQLAAAPADGDYPVIVHVARLSDVKNQALLLRTFAALRNEYPRARLLLVGDGPNRDSLQLLARELHLGDTVSFLGMQGDIGQYLAQSHWFALSSLSEGTPMSVLEAMAAGRAIASTDVGGIAKVVTHGQHGLLSSPDDDNAYLENWRRLARDNETTRKYGEQARITAIENYSSATMTDQYIDVYQESVRARGAQS